MSFNLEEMVKIQNSTGGLLQRKARTMISLRLAELVPRVFLARSLPEKEYQKAMLNLVNIYTGLRNEARQYGARNHGHPSWASAAACESWLHSIMMGDENVAIVEEKVFDLISRPYKSKIKKSAAASIACSLAWKFLTEYERRSSWIKYAIHEVAKLLQEKSGGTAPSAQDIALTLMQAIHYIDYHSDAMNAHRRAIEAQINSWGSGTHFNLRRKDDYLDDAPYLEKFSK
jgi:hypothetical protein